MSRQGTARLEKALTNFSIVYKNSEFIGGDILKDLKVIKDTDKYVVYNSEFRVPQVDRANGSDPNFATWEMSHNSYQLEHYSLADVITGDDRDNSDAPLNLEKDTTGYLIDKIMLKQEIEAHKLLFTTTTFSNNTTLVSNTSWIFHTTSSVPIQNAISVGSSIVKASGKEMNEAIMGRNVLDALKENENVYNRFQYVREAILTKQLLASVWDISKIHVGSSIVDSNKEGASESIGFIWGSDCLFGYFKAKPGLRDVTTAVGIRNMRYGAPYKVFKWHDDGKQGDIIDVHAKWVPKAVATSCAHLMKTVTL